MRGEWRVESAADVAPGFVEAVMVRGCVCEVEGGWVEAGVGEGEALGCGMEEWARKAARKEAKKGRWVGVGISGFVGGFMWCCLGLERLRLGLVGC